MTENEKKQETRKLYRSKENKVVGGVCGGMAEYFNIDPLIIRIAWVFVSLFAGTGIILYIVSLIIIPENPDQESVALKEKKSSGDPAKLFGAFLIIVGGILLLKQMGVFYHFHWLSVPWQGLLAAMLIGLGFYLLLHKKGKQGQGEQSSAEEQGTYSQKSKINTLYRIRENKMIAGVSTGLADYFDIDVTLIRLIWVFAALASGGMAILVYIIAIIIFPESESTAGLSHNGEKS